jgi:hypothetical protein
MSKFPPCHWNLSPQCHQNFQLPWTATILKFAFPWMPFPLKSVKLHSLTAWARNRLLCYPFPAARAHPPNLATNWPQEKRPAMGRAWAWRANHVAAAGAGVSHLGAWSHRGMQLSAGHLQLMVRRRLCHVRAACGRSTSAALPLWTWHFCCCSSASVSSNGVAGQQYQCRGVGAHNATPLAGVDAHVNLVG